MASGHELGFLGIDPYIKRRPHLIKSAHAWMFFGSDIGAPRQANLVHARRSIRQPARSLGSRPFRRTASCGSRLSTKGTAYRPRISSASSTSSTGFMPPIAVGPVRASVLPSAGALWRPWEAGSWPATGTTGQARHSALPCPSRWAKRPLRSRQTRRLRARQAQLRPRPHRFPHRSRPTNKTRTTRSSLTSTARAGPRLGEWETCV